ncbi:hypothetical protein DFS34DRAFT_30412 [Phlyctochytrium arcticum]|nr:hypothetical protein DFS34DRAFT_30412 [Phlyctochytrium arcticum]
MMIGSSAGGFPIGLLLVSLVSSVQAQFLDASIEYGYGLVLNGAVESTYKVPGTNNQKSPIVTGTFSNAPSARGDIVPFAGMPPPDDKSEGSLVHYGDGCGPPPTLMANASLGMTFVGMINATVSNSPCTLAERITNTARHLLANRGKGMILYGSGSDPALITGVKASWPADAQIPTHYMELSLGIYLEKVLASTQPPSNFSYEPQSGVVLYVGQPFPPNFPAPIPAGNVSIMVQIGLRRGQQGFNPPLWKFALVSVGLFTALSIPVLIFMRRRAVSSFMVADPPVPPPSLTLPVAQLANHPTCQWQQVQGSENTECSICLDAFQPDTQVRQLIPCEHCFHAECVDRWLTEVAGVCPLCRTDLIGKTTPGADGVRVVATGGPVASPLWHQRFLPTRHPNLPSSTTTRQGPRGPSPLARSGLFRNILDRRNNRDTPPTPNQQQPSSIPREDSVELNHITTLIGREDPSPIPQQQHQALDCTPSTTTSPHPSTSASAPTSSPPSSSTNNPLASTTSIHTIVDVDSLPK